MSDVWEGTFCGCLPFSSFTPRWEQTIAFPVFLVWGELFVRGAFRRGQYRKGTVVINGFTGSGEVFWEKEISPALLEGKPGKEYPNRFSLKQVMDLSREVLKESGSSKGLATHLSYYSPCVYPEKIKGCWRIYSWKREVFFDLFSGKEELGFELLQGGREVFQ